ncbi:mevalonate kinase [Leptotrichia sp. oral taxon 847]|nr:mevalonate kinase [Leptotrichia sp. oral taxon 847]
MRMKKGIGKAHSKIILLGEHSVVYGYPAIAIPLKKIEIECKILESRTNFLCNKNDTLSVAIFTALKYLKKEKAKIKYNIKSKIPPKRGMGSSAAVSIAAIRAVFNYFDREIKDDLLEKLANIAEITAHQNPSGLDAKTCLSEKPIKFIKNKGFSYIEINLGAYLVIADSGIYGNTKEAVEKVRKLGDIAKEPLKKLGELTERFESLIKNKFETEKVKKIGQIMTNANDELKKIGVTIEKTEIFVKKALENGASGAKISGGGLGGCVIALCKSQKIVKNVKKILIESGAVNIWIEKI